MLFPPNGTQRTAYTRISTASGWTDDKGNLTNWAASQAMVGLMKSKSLQARISSLIARTQDDVYRENKAALREIVQTATQIAQAQARADYGTAVHELSELLDKRILDWQYVPDALKGPLEAYQEAMAPFTVVDTEVFVTVDLEDANVRLAGSMDKLLSHPELDGVVTCDLKTGADEPRYSNKVTTQVALYSKGLRYRDDKFSGTPAFDDGEQSPVNVSFRKPLHPDINTTTGLMIHLPLEPVNGKHKCTMYLLDLERGWENFRLGHRLQGARRHPKLKVFG